MEIEPFCSSYLPDDLLCWSFPSSDDAIVSAAPTAFDPPSDSFDFISSFFDPPQMQTPPPPLPEAPKSAFAGYVRPPHCEEFRGLGGKSAHKSMIEFLRRIPTETSTRAVEKAAAESSDGGSGSRCFRHMMRERQRRERLSQSYADLYSMVSPRSKADKNSIVQSSAVYLRELKAAENRLRRRNQELRARAAAEAARSEGAQIRLRVGNPCAAIDSMIGALRCLKGMDVKARSVRSFASGHELSAAIDVDTDMEPKEVERAVQGVLVEVEKKLRNPRPRQLQQVPRSVVG